MRSDQPSETESMMASALLKIRSDSVCSASPSAKSPVAASPSPEPRSPPALPKKKVSPVAIKSGSSPSSVPIQVASSVFGVRPSFQQQAFTQQQLAAFQIAATSGAPSLPLAAQNQGDIFNLLSRVSSGPLGLLSVQPTHVASSPVSRSVSGVVSGSNGNSKPSTSGLDGNKSPSSGTMIRPEQVEAALKSKSQRGRKRDNLNELERLELTRTRNREHAKSTRIRKKARHQELLDKEQLLEDYQQWEQVTQSRRQCVVDFISIRERNLRTWGLSGKSTIGDATRQISNANQEWKVLEQVVAGVTAFAFEDDIELSEEQFDESLRRVVSKFGKSSIPMLSCNVKGSNNGVALSQNDDGWAEVGIALSGHSKKQLLTGVVAFKFMPDSDKLRSVRWRTVCSALDNQKAADHLDALISHPSVVSLDMPGGKHDRGRDRSGSLAASRDGVKHGDDDGQGPGMSI